MTRFGITISSLTAVVALASCSDFSPPDNLEPVASGDGYQAQYREPVSKNHEAEFLKSEAMNAKTCNSYAGSGAGGTGSVAFELSGEKLTRNDLLDIRVGDDDTFSGSYVVSRDGTLKLPFIDPVTAQGRSTSEVENDISDQLKSGGFYVERPRISVRVADFASVSVAVAGAVFEPHAVEIGNAPGDKLDARRQEALGASTEARNLSVALRAVGGIRPDADISAVELHRGGKVYKLDLRGIFKGSNPFDVMLLTGDHIVVPSRECFQDDLMKPGPISPPGVSLFVSNLTQPATGNASSGIGREVREVAYGTRYLQAVVDTNCVGGSRSTSAQRSAVLFSRNPMTNVSVVIERDIEDLLRRADRDDYDPYLLPGDAIACYDSTITNIAEVGRVLGIIGAGLLLD